MADTHSSYLFFNANPFWAKKGLFGHAISAWVSFFWQRLYSVEKSSATSGDVEFGRFMTPTPRFQDAQSARSRPSSFYFERCFDCYHNPFIRHHRKYEITMTCDFSARTIKAK